MGEVKAKGKVDNLVVVGDNRGVKVLDREELVSAQIVGMK